MLFMTRRLPLKIYLVGFPALINRQQRPSRMGVQSMARSAVCLPCTPACPELLPCTPALYSRNSCNPCTRPALVHVRVTVATHLIAELSPMPILRLCPNSDYADNSQLSARD